MKKNIIISTFCLISIVFAFYAITYNERDKNVLSDLTLANIEALAGDVENEGELFPIGVPCWREVWYYPQSGDIRMVTYCIQAKCEDVLATSQATPSRCLY